MKEPVDYLNLFIIIKSYISCIKFPFVELVIKIIKEKEDIFTERINAELINKMTYIEFKEWSQKRINYDISYYKNGDFYSFSIISNKYIIKESDLEYIKPIYPWKEKILKELKAIEIKDLLKDKKINILKKKIFLLKKYIKKYLK